MRDPNHAIPTQRVPEPPASLLSRYRQDALHYLDHHDRFDWPEHCFEVEDHDDPWESVELHRAIVEREPEKLRNHLHWADALVRTGSIDEALAVAAFIHSQDPTCTETSALILDLLFFQGKTEHEFAWKKAPEVHHLDPGTRGRIYQHVLDSDGFADAFELQFDLFDGEYCNFTVAELADDLERDPRFEIDRFERSRPMILLAGWEPRV